MDHAQEHAIWRAIGELEGEVKGLNEEIEGIGDAARADLIRSFDRTRFADLMLTLMMGLIAASLVAGLVRGTVVQDRPGHVQFTISCPKAEETVCRFIAAEAERLAIEKFKGQAEAAP